MLHPRQVGSAPPPQGDVNDGGPLLSGRAARVSQLLSGRPVTVGELPVARALVLLRLGALPVLAAELWLGEAERRHALFELLLFLVAVYVLVAFAASRRRPASPLAPWALADLALLALLTYASGGAASELRGAFLVVPFGAALLARPRAVIGLTLLACGAYLAAALPPPPGGGSSAAGVVMTFCVTLLWMGVAATALAHLLAQRSLRIADLVASRGRHVAAALDAEDVARRRLAEGLHDHAIQALVVANQDIADAQRGDPDRLSAARELVQATTRQLRETIFELHPTVLVEAGLSTALQAIAERQARLGEYRVVLDVDPLAVGVDDQLVISLTRELLVNAAKHSHAKEVVVTVCLDADALQVSVADDGVGFEPERLRRAVREGHIGLASSAERLEALDGILTVDSRPGAGTHVCARVPLARERRRVKRSGLALAS